MNGSKMAKATVGAAGIEIIQGALQRPRKQNGHSHGNYLVMTHRTAPTTNPNCQRIYSFAANRYERSTEPSSEEVAKRERFAAISRAVALRMNDLTKVAQDTAAFKAQKDEPGGYTTMKSYIWSLEKATYDANH